MCCAVLSSQCPAALKDSHVDDFLLLFDIPTVHCGFCCAAVLNRSQAASEYKTETINTGRMYLRVTTLTWFVPVKMTLFSLVLCQAPCVMLE